jgi:hypothetical protein
MIRLMEGCAILSETAALLKLPSSATRVNVPIELKFNVIRFPDI